MFYIQEGKREERKKLADEDALRKIKQLEEHIVQLQKQVATHKQVYLDFKCHTDMSPKYIYLLL